MKKLLFIIGMICSSIVWGNNDEIFEVFSSKYISKNVKNHTLLVIKYEKLTIDDPIFSQMNVSKEKLEAFIEKENLLIDKYNQSLENLLSKNYGFEFLLIENHELANYPSSKYPYVYKRYVDYQNDELVYMRFFMNRKDKILYKDIHLYSNTVRGRLLVEKDIILALRDFLEE